MMFEVHNQKTIHGYIMKSISSLQTSPYRLVMDAHGYNITLSIQRFLHLISAQAVYDKSVMERFDASLPCGTRLPLWPDAINASLSQEEESNCSFCRYSTLWPSHCLIIYMSSWWGLSHESHSDIEIWQRGWKTRPSPPRRRLWKCAGIDFLFHFLRQ